MRKWILNMSFVVSTDMNFGQLFHVVASIRKRIFQVGLHERVKFGCLSCIVWSSTKLGVPCRMYLRTLHSMYVVSSEAQYFHKVVPDRDLVNWNLRLQRLSLFQGNAFVFLRACGSNTESFIGRLIYFIRSCFWSVVLHGDQVGVIVAVREK